MKHKIITYATLMLFIMMIAVSCSQKITLAKSSDQIQLTSTASFNPVLKRASSNPLLRIRIYIPGSISEKNYQKISCTLNQSAVNDIDELQVYFTNTEPLFDTTNLIAKINPSETNFNIPADIKLSPGLHYIWLSAKLKDAANMNNKIELHCTA